MDENENRWPRRFAALVFATDLLLLNGSFLATSLFKFGTLYPTDAFAPMYFRFHLFVNLVFPLALVLGGAYRDVARSPLGHQATTSLKACLWAGAITIAALFLVREAIFSRIYVVFHLAQVAVLIPFSRIPLERLNVSRRVRGDGVRQVVVAGEREPLLDLSLRLRMAPHLGYRVVAVLPVGFEPPIDRGDAGAPRVVRGRDELREFLASGGASRVFICDQEIDRTRWKDAIRVAQETGVEVRHVPWPILVPDYRTRIHDLLTVPLSPPEVQVRMRGFRAACKRAMDVVLASALLVVLAPVFAAIAAAIRIDSPGPVFYRQERLTRGGRRFRILKFRSMRTLADEGRPLLDAANEATGPLFKMRRDPRVTRVGTWLRRFSLDELPQVWNVLRGELSLVGPRPPVPDEVARYEPWQLQRLAVTGGMTGLWQVSGRSRLSFEEMCLLDLHYAENGSLLLDIEILMETLPTVLHGDGAY